MGKVCDIDIKSHIVQIRAHTHPVSGISVPAWSKKGQLVPTVSGQNGQVSQDSNPLHGQAVHGRGAVGDPKTHRRFFRSATRCGTRRRTAAEVVPSTAQTFANWKSQRTSA